MKKTGMILLASCAVAVASSLTTAFVMRAAGGSHDEDNFYSAQSEPRDGGKHCQRCCLDKELCYTSLTDGTGWRRIRSFL